MKLIFILVVLFLTSCSVSQGGIVSTQFQQLDPESHSYSYGYADPNSQKHESRSPDGVTRGSYSYVDANGHIQSIAYTADPHNGYKAVGTNLPRVPEAGPALASATHHVHQSAYQSHGIHIPILTASGVPLDTPEVQHAKAAHHVAYASAAAAASNNDHHLYKRSLYSGPWSYAGTQYVSLTPAGVPVETPDVQAARAEHLVAHSKALALAAGHEVTVPHDTPEVAQAKAIHFAAHNTARIAHSIAPGLHGYHLPIIHNGVPIETPEVQRAKAQHYAALAQAKSLALYSGGIYHNEKEDDGQYRGY